MEQTAGRVLGRDQLEVVVLGQGREVHDVEIRTPMVATRAGQRRPPKDGGHPFGGRQVVWTERTGRPFPGSPAPLGTCRSRWPAGGRSLGNSRKPRGRCRGRRRRAHGQERRHHLLMQAASGVGQVGQVVATAPGELIHSEIRVFAHLGMVPHPSGGASLRTTCGPSRHRGAVAGSRSWPPPELRE